MPEQVVVGVSLKMYFGHRQARDWFDAVADVARTHDGVANGDVHLFIVPTYLQIPVALSAFAGTRIQVGAQDVATADSGAYTGEVSAAELAEVGVSLAEVGHTERRQLFGETDKIVTAKVAAAIRNGLTPVLCVGESGPLSPADAMAATIEQLHVNLAEAGACPVIVAYEPVWAIGAPEPAPTAHIRAVTTALREAVRMVRPGSSVIYGGSAGPGLLTELGDTVDGLFLGRFAHDPEALRTVLDEASALATHKSL